MSLENGKCPSCGGALLLDNSKEKVVCKFCGHEVVIQQAVQKCKVDGIADFDTLMLSAQRAIDIEQDFDKAAQKYRQALNLRPDDYMALWGIFLCESKSIRYWYARRGYIQVEGDIIENVDEAIKRYGNPAYLSAPDDIKPFYYRSINEFKKSFINTPSTQKKGCYIATAVYGSYNCPSVWVLRRYRDNNLDTNLLGKLFIKIYYAASPTMIRVFGKQKWFNSFWRKTLDKKVAKLKNKGYGDTPYYDV